MRTGTLTGVILAVAALGVEGQPKDGDLVVTAGGGNVVYLNPTTPSTMTTLGRGNPSSLVRMAPNNTDVVVREHPLPFGAYLVNWKPSGVSSIIAVSRYALSGFELDHDGQWILADHDYSNSIVNFIGVQHASGTVTTFFRSQYAWAHDIVIDREPGADAYAVTANRCSSSSCSREIVRHDRQGTHTWFPLSPQGWAGAVEIHPRSGDYIIPYYLLKTTTVPWVVRVNRSGRVTTLTPFSGIAAKITQDDHVWISSSSSLLKYDLTNNAVVTLIPPHPYSSFNGGIEVYGSRRLVCFQPSASPTTVTINVQSRNPLAAGASYILAASPARRPGTRSSNGEWLDLDATHPLFHLTAQNLAPKMFVNFRGTLDSKGNASARVAIPPGLPKMNDMAIFVAGVIYKGSNIIQVTNSHWFVLP